MDIKRIFEDNFDFAFKATTYNNINIAIKTFEQFTKDNQDFFSFDKRKTLFGYLRTYAIEKQFSNSAFKPNSNYSVYMKQVNKYQYKALYIETKDFILNIGRTDNANKLLPKSLYRKKLAKANTELNTQLSFDIENDTNIVVEGKKYAEITYGYLHGEVTHLNIIIPSSDYKKIEHSVNILDNVKIYENYVPEVLIEESIVSLKKSLSKQIK